MQVDRITLQFHPDTLYSHVMNVGVAVCHKVCYNSLIYIMSDSYIYTITFNRSNNNSPNYEMYYKSSINI